MSEKFHLKWNDFQENISSTWNTARASGDFTDVTLVSGDGQMYPAHRVIVAASSSVLSDIMTKVNHPHPLVYVYGVDSKDLVHVLDYIYHGEVRLDQDNLNDFLALAEEFKLIGLTSTVSTNGKCEEKEQTFEPEEWIFQSKVREKKDYVMSKNTLITQPKVYVKWEEIETKIKGVIDKIGDENLNIVDIKKVINVHHNSNGNFYLSIAHTRLRKSFIGQTWKDLGIFNPFFVSGPKTKTCVRENATEDKGAENTIAKWSYQINLQLFDEKFRENLKVLFKPHSVHLK